MHRNISYDSLLKFILSVEKDFTPHLSEKIEISSYSEKLFNNALIFSKFKSDKISALCAVYANDPAKVSAFLSFFAVHKDFRHSGIALDLLAEVESQLKELNFKCINLEVYCNNKSAIKLYTKAGYLEKEKLQNSDILYKNIQCEIIS